ncbi:hypothetical protein HMPREF0731_4776, partial [Pseudoroseomonas cervicalis ATCC 49957]
RPRPGPRPARSQHRAARPAGRGRRHRQRTLPGLRGAQPALRRAGALPDAAHRPARYRLDGRQGRLDRARRRRRGAQHPRLSLTPRRPGSRHGRLSAPRRAAALRQWRARQGRPPAERSGWPADPADPYRAGRRRPPPGRWRRRQMAGTPDRTAQRPAQPGGTQPLPEHRDPAAQLRHPAGAGTQRLGNHPAPRLSTRRRQAEKKSGGRNSPGPPS